MSVNISSELMDYDVILASASPRRKELLSLMCENFRVIPSDCDEKIPEDVTPELAPEYLSGIKCRCIASVYDLSVVIGCDTVVICDGEVLGKPVDEADAIRMLKMLFAGSCTGASAITGAPAPETASRCSPGSMTSTARRTARWNSS
jgi:septum formation protein